MKAYIAGAWKHRENIGKHMDEALKAGIDVVSGWIQREERDDTPQTYAECAKADTDEVASCDVLIAVMDDPEYAYRGTGTEIGCALGLKKRVIIICPGSVQENGDCRTSTHYCMRNVFYWHPGIEHVKTFAEALELLQKAEKIEEK